MATSIPPLNTNGLSVKRALSIAVQYNKLDKKYPDWGLGLKHAYQDLDHIQRLLDAFGYKKEDITILKDDHDGTTAPYPDTKTIIRAMEDLIAGAKAGDRFVFHFSGHGSQKIAIKDKNEKDGKDEVIWPADVDVAYEAFADGGQRELVTKANYILDDTIREILVERLPPGAHLVMIFDCCHSGTAADLEHCHSDHKTNLAELADALKGRGAQIQSYQTSLDAMSPAPFSPGGDTVITAGQVISWSACKDPQVTYATSLGGIFIKAFVDVLTEYLQCPRCKLAKESPSGRQFCEHLSNVSHEAILHSVTAKLGKWTKRINDSVTKLNRNRSEGEKRQAFTAPRPQLGSRHDYGETLKSSIISMF